MPVRILAQGDAMNRASYREAIDWIARNDSAADDSANDPRIVQHLITAVLIADIFCVDYGRVGRDIVRRRAKISAERTP